MLRVGLTGNIGSGKSTVCSAFSIFGIPVFHADERSKRILQSVRIRNEVIKNFGSIVLGDNGLIDTRILAGLVFGDPGKLKLLNSLLHPLVIKDFDRFCRKEAGSHYVIMEAAVLFESGYAGVFDRIIVVSCPRDIAVQRVIDRDGILPELILRRMKFQAGSGELEKKADYVIINDGRRKIMPQVLRIHNKLMASG